MSEEQNQPTTKVNNELTERVNAAYIANNFTLLNGGTDNIIMISGEKNEAKADILATYDAIEQVLSDLKSDIQKIEKAEPPVTDELV
jgi:hypothetical protein